MRGLIWSSTTKTNAVASTAWVATHGYSRFSGDTPPRPWCGSDFAGTFSRDCVDSVVLGGKCRLFTPHLIMSMGAHASCGNSACVVTARLVCLVSVRLACSVTVPLGGWHWVAIITHCLGGRGLSLTQRIPDRPLPKLERSVNPE